MTNLFKQHENEAAGFKIELKKALDHMIWDDKGLMPVIVQEATSKEVIMFAWMNREALELTLETGKATYWSRSRQSLWVKGETSGNTQKVRGLQLDCDGDAFLMQVDQIGEGACHTNRASCFFYHLDENRVEIK
jgi:phosphoribosyl-AMP cyclohydrolase